ncbi:hypothetical protein SDC9_99776 [bioreactor metagenome]|uniref:Uncharacterized protein n=1 Tax=bioreactor metagenome TaxID=1076179 RepID=A0A645AIG1_9ZZZZ
MIKRLSTFFSSSLIPCSALLRNSLPSSRNGSVTTPTVKSPMSLAIFAITGVAPVPVPPPIPAVTNTISVPPSSDFWITSMLSIAAFLPFSGLHPAPRPRVTSLPSWIFSGIGLALKAWLSVLQIKKSTSLIPWRYIWFTALPPPPPTPITLIIDFPYSQSVGKYSSIIMQSYASLLVVSNISPKIWDTPPRNLPVFLILFFLFFSSLDVAGAAISRSSKSTGSSSGADWAIFFILS